MSLDVAPVRRAMARTGARPRRLVRMLRAGFTTPERLSRVAAGLLAGCLLTAVVSVLGGLAHTGAVHESGTRIAALSADAAELYRSLADADATATRGYVSGGLEPAAVRARYDDDIARAADRVVQAASQLPAGDPAAIPVASIGAQLPVYAGLMETARTYNRLGLPLGQSYLDSASRLMRATMLPAAEELRRMQTAALEADYERGGAIPFAVLLIGAAVLAGLVDHTVLERRRTNKIKDKVWIHGPGGEPWKVYTVKAAAPAATSIHTLGILAEAAGNCECGSPMREDSSTASPTATACCTGHQRRPLTIVRFLSPAGRPTRRRLRELPHPHPDRRSGAGARVRP